MRKADQRAARRTRKK